MSYRRRIQLFKLYIHQLRLEYYEELSIGKLDTVLTVKSKSHMQTGKQIKLPLTDFHSHDKAMAAGIWKGMS